MVSSVIEKGWFHVLSGTTAKEDVCKWGKQKLHCKQALVPTVNHHKLLVLPSVV